MPKYVGPEEVTPLDVVTVFGNHMSCGFPANLVRDSLNTTYSIEFGCFLCFFVCFFCALFGIFFFVFLFFFLRACLCGKVGMICEVCRVMCFRKQDGVKCKADCALCAYVCMNGCVCVCVCVFIVCNYTYLQR